jgi:phosphomannomutase
VLPTPALALHAMAAGGPAIMVTGSHIPADRNGLKFYTPQGEITKDDEQGILAALTDEVPAGSAAAEDGFAAAGDRYRQRYRHFLPPETLSGWSIGVFEHSSVARDLLVSLFTRAGADVARLGRSERFVAVDTEATGDPVFASCRRWIADYRLDAIVSTDGDADRPLVIDAEGRFLRGDALGLIAAQLCGAESIVTPVTSNSALETAGGIKRIRRTKVGSPFVVAGMDAARASGERLVVGFEANGGVLLGADARIGGASLAALPTRDSILPILAVFATAAARGQGLGETVAGLGLSQTTSDRIAGVASEDSAEFLRRLTKDTAYPARFFAGAGKPVGLSSIDGPRFRLSGGEIVHYRPSGNAPELRCYVEAASEDRARWLLGWAMGAARDAMAGG